MHLNLDTFNYYTENAKSDYTLPRGVSATYDWARNEGINVKLFEWENLQTLKRLINETYLTQRSVSVIATRSETAREIPSNDNYFILHFTRDNVYKIQFEWKEGLRKPTSKLIGKVGGIRYSDYKGTFLTLEQNDDLKKAIADAEMVSPTEEANYYEAEEPAQRGREKSREMGGVERERSRERERELEKARQVMYPDDPPVHPSFINSNPFRITPTKLPILHGNPNILRSLLESVINNSLLNEFVLDENTYVRLRNNKFITLYFFIALRAQALLFNVIHKEGYLVPDDSKYAVIINSLKGKVIDFSKDLEQKIITAIEVAFYLITSHDVFNYVAYSSNKEYLDKLLELLNQYIIIYTANLTIGASNDLSALPIPAQRAPVSAQAPAQAPAPGPFDWLGLRSPGGSKKKKTTKKSRKQKKAKRSKSSKKK